MLRLPEFMKNMGKSTNQKMLIADIVEKISLAKKEIEEQVKYHNLQWKVDMLIDLKKEAMKLYQLAIDEANTVNADYEKRISEVETMQYVGNRINKDDALTVDFEFRTLKAELNMTDNKEQVIEKYLASKIGAKAVLMLFADKDVDLGYQAHNIYVKAFNKAKTQAELDFEVKKQEQIANLRLEQTNKVNIGNLLAAQRIMQGNPSTGSPSLENIFDAEIRNTMMQIENERKALREEVKTELLKEEFLNKR